MHYSIIRLSIHKSKYSYVMVDDSSIWMDMLPEDHSYK